MSRPRPLVLFLLVCAAASLRGSSSFTGCEGEFQGRCGCGYRLVEGVRRWVTNCTRTGFQDASMLRQLPVETDVLIFTGNNVTSLPPNLFGVDNDYQNLTYIDLSANNISRIQGKAFHRVPNVRKLVLNDNRWLVDNHSRLFANMDVLEELHLNRALDVAAPGYIDSSDALYNRSIDLLMSFFQENPLKNLRKIQLEGNGIGPRLHMDIFCALPNLEDINLANNSITKLVWTDNCLHRLRHLNLSGNLLRSLTNETLRHLDDIDHVTLDLNGNAFDCDCGITDFQNWLLETDVNVVGKEGFLCQDGFPEENANHRLLDIPREMLRCENLLVYRPLGIAHVVLVIVIVLIVSLLSVVAFMNRRIIVHTVRRFGEPLYRRMQYSTIQKQEAEREMEI